MSFLNKSFGRRHDLLPDLPPLVHLIAFSMATSVRSPTAQGHICRWQPRWICQTCFRVYKTEGNFPQGVGCSRTSVSSINSLLSTVFMRNMPTFPISSFRWPGNNCTGWNNHWNHSCSWNPCRNNNCCCKEDVRQVLVSKLLISLFKQASSSEQGHRNRSGDV